HRARATSGQVGAGVRLREALAPHLLAGQDAAEKAALLLLGAVLDEGRPDERRSHPDVDHAGGARARVLLGEQELLDRRGAPAPVPGRAWQPCPCRAPPAPLPPAPCPHRYRPIA